MDNRAVSMHVGVYLVYLISLFYFYYTFIKNVGAVGSKKFLFQISIKNGLATLALVALAYLFYIICSGQTTEETQPQPNTVKED